MNNDERGILSGRGVMLTWRMLAGIGACAIAGMLAYMGVTAQAQGGIRPLTADDREELRELIHRYAFALENCPGSNNGYDYADLFTEDGRFGLGENFRGREALARAAGRQPDGSCASNRYRGPLTKFHLYVNEIFRASPEGARGTVYLIMMDGPGGQPYWDGWYEDIYARTPKGWRFKQRVHVWQGRAGVPPAAIQQREEIAKASFAMKADPSILVSRNPVKWVDGIDNRPLEDTPAYARSGGGGRQGGAPGRGGRGQ
jgi:hypothetical protein